MSKPEVNFRADIQALRGLAILLVLAYHARSPVGPAAGYLGVDVFFVVSGFLITGIIRKGIASGRFSFAGFYFRRAKRLLPAAYCVFAGTAVLSALFLTTAELRDFCVQLVGAVTFTGNIVLWRQTGYFQGAAELKPLLHVWSLSLEEQYYLIVPATLVLVPRRFWAAGAWLVVIASLALCAVAVRFDPSATFYLLPTRAWELGFGSLGVLALDHERSARAVRWLFWPALSVLVLLPFVPTGLAHPGIDAFLVCLATLVVILRQYPAAGEFRVVRALAWLGDISYSLYLVHWPLFAIAATAWVSTVPGVVRFTLAVLSVLIAWVLYRFVENPIREADIRIGPKPILLAGAASVMVCALGAASYTWQLRAQDRDYRTLMRPNPGFDATCEFSQRFEDRAACRRGSIPTVLVWGDSHAMHLVPGIAATTDRGVIQATKSVCGPFFGLALVEQRGDHNRLWAENCIRFNDSVLAYIERTPSVQVVVLASVSSQYLAGSRVLRRVGSGMSHLQVVAGGDDVAAQALEETVRRVRALHRRVILVSSMPMSDFDVGRCLELRETGRPVFGADTQDCSVDEGRYREERAGPLRLIAKVEGDARVPVIRLDQALCQHGRCATRLGDVLLYRDRAHLSYEGSVALARRLQLGERIYASAR